MVVIMGTRLYFTWQVFEGNFTVLIKVLHNNSFDFNLATNPKYWDGNEISITVP